MITLLMCIHGLGVNIKVDLKEKDGEYTLSLLDTTNFNNPIIEPVVNSSKEEAYREAEERLRELLSTP